MTAEQNTEAEGARKKPSSLRDRIDRRQKGLGKGPNWIVVLVILLVVVAAGVALFFAFK